MGTAETALEAIQAAIIDSAMDAIIAVDEELRIQLFNSAAEKMFRYHAAEVMGQPVERLLPERFRATHSEHIRSFALSGLTKRSMGALGAISGLRADGEEFPIEASIAHFVAGEKKMFAVILRDISKRLPAEELRNRLAAIVESTRDAILAIDVDGIITSWNEGAEQMYGYAAPEAIGKSVSMLMPADQPAELATFMQTVHTGVAQEDYETERVTRDGGRIQVWMTISALRDSSGAIVGASTIARDITERKRAENALRESEARFAAAFRESPAGMTITSQRDGKFVDANESFLTMFGYRREEVNGRAAFELNLYVNPAERAELVRLIREEGGAHSYEMVMRTKTGDFRNVLFSTAGVEFGGEAHILAILFDITSRKQAEQEVRQLNADLERRVEARTSELVAANLELEAFSYSVSHDLRAPLRHIGGYVELLQKNAAPALDEKNRRYLNIISEAGLRMGTLIDELLAFSRIGRSDLKKSRFAMLPVVQEIIRELEPDIQGRELSWQIGPLPEAHADRRMLRLVWANLISNALKYTRTRAQAVVEIGCTAGENETVYFIRDNGVGFDMKYSDKLFGVFQRLHSAREFEGTGVGLANVRRIVARHGGLAWAEGAVQAGATFYFSLPTQKES